MGKRKEIGGRIRAARITAKMTQAEVAKRIHQSPSSITMYETGRREPDFETLEALADIFNIPLASLIGSEQKENLSTEYQSNIIQVQHPETRILAHGFDQLPEESRKKALEMMNLMFGPNFTEGNDDQ